MTTSDQAISAMADRVQRAWAMSGYPPETDIETAGV
jgi:hypothetical protein